MRGFTFGVLLWIGVAFGAQAQDADIRDTIDQQLQAFQSDDFGAAFEFASPSLQTLFQTPENFRRMVTQGYPMVWRPGAVRYLDLRHEAGTYWQNVMITDQAGKAHVLEYRMLQTDSGWRINGVRFVRQPGANV
ncbi:MAG: DUF4864 domain-containing protein [Sulfitobacter sp.]